MFALTGPHTRTQTCVTCLKFHVSLGRELSSDQIFTVIFHARGCLNQFILGACSCPNFKNPSDYFMSITKKHETVEQLTKHWGEMENTKVLLEAEEGMPPTQLQSSCRILNLFWRVYLLGFEWGFRGNQDGFHFGLVAWCFCGDCACLLCQIPKVGLDICRSPSTAPIIMEGGSWSENSCKHCTNRMMCCL